MNKVAGKVLVKETGMGIPNLLIVIYDLDPNTMPEEILKSGQLICDEDFWSQFHADRIGSVLTNANGEFELTYEDAEFQIRNQEKRPDLILLVMAPEEPISPEQPIPEHPSKRTLHYSNISRANAGKTESYIIRLLKAQLDKKGIPYPQAPPSISPNIDDLLASLDKSFARRDAIQAKLNARTAHEVTRINKFKQKAKEAFKNFSLSSFSPQIRSEATYLPKGGNLKAAQETIINRDLKRLAESKFKRSVRLYLSDEEIKEWGLIRNEDGSLQGEVPLQKVLDRIEKAMHGTELFFVRSPLEISLTEKNVDKILDKITGSSDGDRPDSPKTQRAVAAVVAAEDTNGDDSTTDAFVGDKVATLTDTMTSPETDVQFEPQGRPAQGDILGNIRGFSLTDGGRQNADGSPTDAIAYHDFYNLEIAFEHIWTELFDPRLEGLGKQLYEEWVKTVDPTETGAFDDTFLSTVDLQQLLADISTFSDQVIFDAPDNVRDHLQSDITAEQWSRLSPSSQATLITMADQVAWWEELLGVSFSGFDERARSNIDRLQQEARNIIVALPPDTDTTPHEIVRVSPRLQRLVDQLRQRLREPHKFDTFATNSVNFGVLVTYRQKWQPISYQVGELVSTIPLAPKEVRKYSKKQVVKKNRSEKEMENSTRVRKEESSNTARVDAEIVRKATNKTDFKLATEGSVNFGIGSAETSASFETEAGRESSNTKKDFRESVMKAGFEYKQEHQLQVETQTSTEIEETFSGEISNPNDELTVTYLFYELQRRYEISEKIHRVTPVVLVANEVPSPEEIDEDWLIAHDWILRRVILDDSFLPTLDLLSSSTLSAEITQDVLRANLTRNANLVEEIKLQIASKTTELTAAMSTGAAEGVLDAIESELRDLRTRLNAGVTALQEATDKYTQAIKENLDRQAQIARLRIHVKDNILYYMQAIWNHEPTDQRFFRLYNIDVPIIEEPSTSTGVGYRIVPFYGAGIMFMLPPSDFFQTKRLVEIAELDNLLGYKGNYMIFPLKQNNYLTTYLMQPYIDERMGLRDPDEFGNFTTDEFVTYIQSVYNDTPAEFARRREEFRDQLMKRLMNPWLDKEEIIVPTNSLYIEALPGDKPILEDFKLAHRAVDVKKVQAEVRRAELENIRLAARLLSGEREDPDIEKKIIVNGTTTTSTIEVGGDS